MKSRAIALSRTADSARARNGANDEARSATLALLVVWSFGFVLALLSSGLFGTAFGAPACIAGGRPLPVDNARVIRLEDSTPNETHDRAHVQGPIVRVYRPQSGHAHFSVSLGQGRTIEVVYNSEFGSLPQLAPGMMVEACGDYITANKRSGQYPPSPDGAILHWVHASDTRSHDSGFVMVGNQLFGQKMSGRSRRF